MPNIIPFHFKATEVRTIEKDNLIWFIASDVAKALGYRGAETLTRILDDDEKGTHNMCTPGGNQQLTVINESGLYHAVLKSRKPEAKPFRKWVTSEVLPAIRQHGKYEATRPTTLTPAMQRHIQRRVAELANRPGGSFPAIYRDIKDHFQVGSYKDIQQEHYPDLCRFLHCDPIEGEYLGKVPPMKSFTLNSRKNLAHKNYLTFRDMFDCGWLIYLPTFLSHLQKLEGETIVVDIKCVDGLIAEAKSLMHITETQAIKLDRIRDCL